MTYNIISGVVEPEVPGWTGFIDRVHGEVPGMYQIHQATLQLADGENGFLETNYELVVIPGELTITPLETIPGGTTPGGSTP